MNKKLLLLLMAVLMLPAIAKAQTPTLVLHHAKGNPTEIELYTMPRIQMTDTKMVITVQGTRQEFDKADVVRFTFKGIVTGISAVKSETRYRVDEDRVTFYGVSTTDRISIHNASGMRLPISLTTDGADTVLPLSQLPKGVYLVTVNGRTLKFIRP